MVDECSISFQQQDGFSDNKRTYLFTIQFLIMLQARKIGLLLGFIFLSLVDPG